MIKALKAIIPPISLIIIVLGSIFTGIATPTESASFGALGSFLLAFIYKEFSIKLKNITIFKKSCFSLFLHYIIIKSYLYQIYDHY